MDADSETFVMHVAIQEQEKMTMDLERKAQIEIQVGAQSGAQSGVQVKAFNFNKALTEVSVEYSNYSNVFSAENAAEFLKKLG